LFDPDVSLSRTRLTAGARPNRKKTSRPGQGAHGMVGPYALQGGGRGEEGSRQGKGGAGGRTGPRGGGRGGPRPHNSSLAPALEKECARCDAKKGAATPKGGGYRFRMLMRSWLLDVLQAGGSVPGSPPLPPG